MNKNFHRSIRLKGYDYSQPGGYFVTICTKAKEPYFERYVDLHNIVKTELEALPGRFPNIAIDMFVIMPNHIHLIIQMARPYTSDLPATARVAGAGSSPAATLGRVIGAYKSLCMNKWVRLCEQTNINIKESIWQRNYYERIIRNEEELNLIRQYIIHNPQNWMSDRNNPGYIQETSYEREWNWLETEIEKTR